MRAVSAPQLDVRQENPEKKCSRFNLQMLMKPLKTKARDWCYLTHTWQKLLSSKCVLCAAEREVVDRSLCRCVLTQMIQ